MKHGSSDRVPASSLILFASIVFTLVTFSIFKLLWEIPIHVYLLIAILGLQAAALLLGSSKVLTQLGAASLAALVAMVASIAAVFTIFPQMIEVRIAGGAGSVSALIFVLASFVAASREDPVPASVPEPLNLGDLESDPSVELIKYGEVRAPEASDIHELPLSETAWGDEIPEEFALPSEDLFSTSGNEDVNEIDELFEKGMGEIPGIDDNDPASSSQGMVVEGGSMQEDELMPSTDRVDDLPDADSDEEDAIIEDWVEDTARVMAYSTTGAKQVDTDSIGSSDGENLRSEAGAAESMPDFRMRTRYKVLDEASGEHYGTYYGDEGYSTLDIVSLAGLLSSRLAAGELRIVKLDWSNFDEVEVHVRVEEELSIDVGVDVKDDADKGEPVSGQSESGIEALPDDGIPVDDPSDEIPEEEVPHLISSNAPSYMIYDRRTIQPMGEYLPEGERSRIDRLALYKMFPEYDFKTFEIDSIRWEAGEVRIFIREKRKKVQSPEFRVQRKSLDSGNCRMMIDRGKGSSIVNYKGQERRAGGDRRSCFDRREMPDFARLGTDMGNRESIMGRREAGRRFSDRTTLQEQEMMR